MAANYGLQGPRIGWYGKCFRKLFFDFHSSQHALGLAAAFDAEGWAERCAQAGAQAVSVFIKCGFGWSFYRKGSIRYVHPQLPEGLDMVEAQIEAFHRRGIKTIGYYHTFNSEPIARDHPDWARRDASGRTPEPKAICMQGPVFEEWMLPHLVEVVTNYEIDAMFFDGTYAWGPCYCPTCRRRFREAAGEELPAGPEDPRWEAYVSWALEDYRRIRQAISDTLHAHRPDMPTSFNWAYTMRMPESVPEHVGNLMLDVPPEDQAFNGSYQARHWALTGVPFDIMNSAFLQWWGDWACKPATCLKHEVAPAIANGGLTWIGYQMTHTFDVAEPVMRQLGEALAFVKEREHLLEGAKVVPCVLVLHSTQSHFTHGARLMVDEAAMRGAHRLFLETGLPHNFVDEHWLLNYLRTTPAAERAPVIVLSDQRRLEPELVQALQNYVLEGGGLLVTAYTATLGPDMRPAGRCDLQELLGLRFVGSHEQSHSYLVVTEVGLDEPRLAMPHLLEAPAALVEPVAKNVKVLAELWGSYVRADGQPLLRWSPPGEPTGYPAITFRKVGKGAVAYCAHDVFRAYHAKNEWTLKHIVETLVRRVAPGFPIKVEAPAWLEVTLAAQDTPAGRRTVVHLCNYHGNRPFDASNLCIEQTLPVRRVKVTLMYPQRPRKITLEPGGVEPRWTFRGRKLTVRIPEVEIHTAVLIE